VKPDKLNIFCQGPQKVVEVKGLNLRRKTTVQKDQMNKTGEGKETFLNTAEGGRGWKKIQKKAVPRGR